MSGQKIVYDTLALMGIEYRKTEHRAMYSSSVMDECGIEPGTTVSKNLFLRDAKGRTHYLVVLPIEKTADLKQLAEKLGSTRLSFASEERLQKYLGVKAGSVSAFSVLNDVDREVIVVFDRTLSGTQKFALHPNENTASLYMNFADVERIVKAHGNKILYLDV